MKKTLFAVKLYVLAMLEIAFAHLFNYMSSKGMILGANTLTAVIPDLYEALDVVSREQIGFIPAVLRDSAAERAAVGQVIDIPIVPASSAADITPGELPPNTGDVIVGSTPMTISKSRQVSVRWTGEEQKGVRHSGMYPSVQQQRIQQAFRTLCNEVEADLAGLYVYASRAYGTPGTAPFGVAADLTDSAQVLRILEDNGAPGDYHAVLGGGAIANIRGKQSVLFKANEAGTDDLLRRGIIGDIHGLKIHNSSAVKTPTKGTGASYTTNTAGYAVGATAITLITGTGTVLAGDPVTFAGDTNKYIVETGVAAAGTIKIAEPGLRQAIPGSATAMTIAGTSERSMVFARSAIALITRAPAMPEEGDMSDDVIEITDPHSGLAFQIVMYKQYRQVKLEIGLAWGQKMIAPRHTALLLG